MTLEQHPVGSLSAATSLPDARAADASELAAMLGGRRWLALTGAGCSTESGIPDYRGPGTARRARNPIRFADFVASEPGQRRYWARSFVGWPRIARAEPNGAHHALARLERRGLLTGLLTQNVDRLHTRAGSRSVVELHGALAEVICLACGALEDRGRLQERLAAANPGFGKQGEAAPDGDAEIDGTEQFVVVGCPCGGPYKPHVVFFGEGVPRDRVDAGQRGVEDADGLLVLGTSLAVFSGLRFPRLAHRLGKPVVVVNLGPTRADGFATFKCPARLGEVLPALADALGA